MESSILDDRLRNERGIPIEKHDNVVTFYEDYSSYQEVLGTGDINLAYVFLLDKKGIVRWSGHGYTNTEIEKEFIDVAKALIRKSD